MVLKAGTAKHADVLSGTDVFGAGTSNKYGRPEQNRCFGEPGPRKGADVPNGIAALGSLGREKVRTS